MIVHRPTPETVAGSLLTRFLETVGQPDAAALQRWALAEPTSFWRAFLAWSELPVEGSAEPAIEGDAVETARFFPNLRLNFAQAVLHGVEVDPDAIAITTVTESRTAHLSWRALRQRVARVAGGLRDLGVTEGDRVVAVVCNTADAVVAALATAALGATWSSAAPDMAPAAILQRFAQLAPRWLITNTEREYQGRVIPVDLDAIRAGLPTLEKTLDACDLPEGEPAAEWTPRLFDHPLYVLFSSGTTGAPKCIVHGAGGTLLEHVKEHRLHCDLKPGDTLLYTTTTGWMMWNWLVSGLASGVRVVLYDGSPSHPARDSLLRAVAEQKVTHFGASPTYLQFLDDGGVDPKTLDLSNLRAVMSTGSVLQPWQYDWFREHFGDLPLQSISGGTDIVGCFVLGNPNAPVVRGESQTVSFGYDVRVKTTTDVYEHEGVGELVCCAPFPSRPIGLWNDPIDERFHDAYFAENEGVWTHGDFLELTETGARILGRSDAVMNIRGVRVGPAEIYTALHDFEEYRALMAVTQPDARAAGGNRLVLLAVMAEGVQLDRKLALRTKKALKQRTSMYHVPAVVAAVSDLPTTHSGKRSERAARDLLAGRPVRNRHALRNPEILDELLVHPDLQAV